jgi:phosphoserine phosphatase
MPLYKLALFDLDGTLTKERSAWEYIHRRLGVWEGYAEKFQEAFLRGEITYDRFCQLDAAIWKGMKVSDLERILAEIPLYEGVEDFLLYLRSKGIKLGIISSGLTILSERMRKEFRFDYAVANELGVADGILTGEIVINVHYDKKGDWVQEAQRRFNARQEEILAIGDSTGDIDMFQMAGLSIAFNPLSPRLKALATFSIHSMDLRDLIPSLAPHLDGGKS